MLIVKDTSSVSLFEDPSTTDEITRAPEVPTFELHQFEGNGEHVHGVIGSANKPRSALTELIHDNAVSPSITNHHIYTYHGTTTN